MVTPAKVTLRLHVGAPRADAYHDVRIAMVAVSLYDTVQITPRSSGGVALSVASPWPLGAVQHNILQRAAQAFQEAAGRDIHVGLHLDKRVPVQAGLGGGSANAAGLLCWLNALHGCALDTEGLARVAATLGSDVPFFLTAAPAWATGRGERLRPLTGLPQLHLLVVKPPLSISTAAAYAAVTSAVKALPPTADPPLDSVAAVAANLCNDFEPPLLDAHASLREVRRALLDSGALGVSLSGSGSAQFGVYRTAAEVQQAAQSMAAQSIAEHADWDVLPCHTLAGISYVP